MRTRRFVPIVLGVVVAVVTLFPAATARAQPKFGGWESLGGALRGAPAVSSWSSGRLDVFVRGTDDAMWHKWWDGNTWSGWEYQSGVLSAHPSAVSWGPN